MDRKEQRQSSTGLPMAQPLPTTMQKPVLMLMAPAPELA
jgi:hypothetical protein